MIESAAAAPLLVLARFGKWSEVIATPAPNAGPTSTVLSYAARAIAFARLGDVPAAERERAAFQESRKALTDDPGIFQNSPKSLALVAEAVVDGRIAEAKGDGESAVRAYRRAVEAEDALDYDEPADWFYPTRETLGGALLRSGQPADAESVFREDLKRNPNNPRSLFGLMKAREAQKKSAATTAAAFRREWRGAALRVEDL